MRGSFGYFFKSESEASRALLNSRFLKSFGKSLERNSSFEISDRVSLAKAFLKSAEPAKEAPKKRRMMRAGVPSI